DHRAIAPQRLARVVREDLRNDAHRGKNQNVNLRMCEEPEEVLPQQRVTAAGDIENLTADDETARQEEARVQHAIAELQNGGCFERREREEKKESRDELRPDEERQ